MEEAEQQGHNQNEGDEGQEHLLLYAQLPPAGVSGGSAPACLT